jgi:hypothetical protein
MPEHHLTDSVTLEGKKEEEPAVQLTLFVIRCRFMCCLARQITGLQSRKQQVELFGPAHFWEPRG